LDLHTVKKAINGDEEAFLAFMHFHKEALYRTALSYVKNEHDAIEAVQEVTFRAYRKIHSLKEPAYAKTWLIRIMINYCQDELKKKKRFTSQDQLDQNIAIYDSSMLVVEEAIATLSPEQQQLVHMKYFLDIQNKELAAIHKVPEGTIKSRLHSALSKLRVFFSEKGESKNEKL